VQLLAHASCHIGIQVTEGFVQEQQHRSLNQGPCERHTLLLAARQFMRVPALKPFQSDQPEHVLDAGFAFVPAQPAQAECNVLMDAQMREQRIFLKHHADVSIFGCYHVIDRRH
jgi:hypothetical protein